MCKIQKLKSEVMCTISRLHFHFCLFLFCHYLISQEKLTKLKNSPTNFLGAERLGMSMKIIAKFEFYRVRNPELALKTKTRNYFFVELFFKRNKKIKIRLTHMAIKLITSIFFSPGVRNIP